MYFGPKVSPRLVASAEVRGAQNIHSLDGTKHHSFAIAGMSFSWCLECYVVPEKRSFRRRLQITRSDVLKTRRRSEGTRPVCADVCAVSDSSEETHRPLCTEA